MPEPEPEPGFSNPRGIIALSLNRDRTTLGAILVLVVVLFSDILFLGNGLFFRDIFRYHFPMKRVVREAMLIGEFPYWNRFFSSGQPLAANPAYELFYPPQWLILLPDYHFGFQLHILLHIAIGAVGMYMLLRSLELRREAIVFGTISFVFGGMFLSLVNVLPFFFSVAWLPVVACFARKYMLTGDRRALLGAALALGMQALIGEPMTMAQTWVLIGGYAIYRFTLSALLRAGVVIGSGAALGAIQLLPAADHLRDSVRANGFAWDVVSRWSMPPVRALESTAPHLLGRISENGLLFWGADLYAAARAPFILSLYCGIAVMPLVIAGLLRRSRVTAFVLGALLLSFILAIGSHTPLLRLLYDAKLMRSFRYPEKFILSGMFVAIVFAAATFSRFVEGDERIRRTALRATAVIATLLGLYAVVVVTSFERMWSLPANELTSIQKGLARGDALLGFAFAAGALVLLWMAMRRGIGQAWCAAAILFLLADLLRFTPELLPRMPRDFFTAPPAAAAGVTLFHEADWYDSPTRRRYFALGSDTPWVVRNGLFPLTPAAWGTPIVLNRDYDETSLAASGELVATMLEWRARTGVNWSLPFAKMAGATHRTGFRPFDAEMARAGSDVEKIHPVEIVPVANPSRYRFATELLRASRREDVLRLLEGGKLGGSAALVAFDPFRPGPARIVSVSERNNSVSFDVDARDRAFLVAAITRHKYWTATVDGRTAPIDAADIAFSGIAIPPGRHTVVMRYRNPMIAAGAAVSAVALLALVANALRRRVTA